jgi:hypothetical protein
MLTRFSLSRAVVARSKIERSVPLGMMQCEIGASSFVAIRQVAFGPPTASSDQA